MITKEREINKRSNEQLHRIETKKVETSSVIIAITNNMESDSPMLLYWKGEFLTDKILINT